MDTILDQPTIYRTMGISDLTVGDKLVNLGEILEITEREESYSIVILRMEQRQVWTFGKTDELIIQ